MNSKPVVIKGLGFTAARHKVVQAQCMLCKRTFKTLAHLIESGNTKSCGCLAKRRYSFTQKYTPLEDLTYLDRWVDRAIKQGLNKPKIKHNWNLIYTSDWRNNIL